MDSFAFMIHPLDETDVERKFSVAKYLPDCVVRQILKLIPPFKASDITGVASKHNEISGCFVTCPLTARQMTTLPEPFVMDKIIKAGKVAEAAGAKVLGLGAFTSVIGDAGITVAKHLKIPVTTGNSYTVATALEGAKMAAAMMGHNLDTANIAIIGANGSIGSVCANILAREARHLKLVGKDEVKLQKLAHKILYETGLVAKIGTDVRSSVNEADIVICVTSSVDVLINPEDLKPGAVICDVSRPRNVSRQVAELRNDVLVIEGGLVEVPGDVDFNLNFGFPPGMAYACMAETMILALEQKYESYTLGRELNVQQVLEISKLAKKHGFKVAGFRSFEKAVTDSEIMAIKKNAVNKMLVTETA
ncbi:MAG: shikimate dehydrogenase [Thermincola sp.]|jgi:predicted amino acid dehydrogenase|nr:shikimate dehydrogenase [Thermincola sp.]MDT3702170.1 shikimate dehydrogenase [Thermincola sp.]